jgi:MFS transporter, DHA1 family, multidrug resistance protein
MKFRQATQWSLAIMLKRMERSRDRIAGPTADFQSKARTESKDNSITASIAVICAFAAMGLLATNIFLPSLATMAADLHVSSATITSTI